MLTHRLTVLSLGREEEMMDILECMRAGHKQEFILDCAKEKGFDGGKLTTLFLHLSYSRYQIIEAEGETTYEHVVEDHLDGSHRHERVDIEIGDIITDEQLKTIEPKDTIIDIVANRTAVLSENKQPVIPLAP